MVDCVDGKYEPAKPSSFVCQPAAALIVTHTGEVEVISSSSCSMALDGFRNFSGHGRSASLLDNELVILGNDTLSGTGGNYITIQNPREGLLAMKYTIESFPTRGSPFHHTALQSENRMTVIGGKYRTRAKLEEYTWFDINLKWEESNKGPFAPKFFSACTVKDAQNSFYVFGGAQTLGEVTSVRNTILHINTSSLLVKEVGTMQKSRMSFGCAVFSKGVFLLSGGYSNPSSPLDSIVADELFDVARPDNHVLLPKEGSLNRFQHQMVRMNQSIFAFGGLTEDNSTTDKIKMFNKASESWEEYDKLKSKDTRELVSIPFPISSLDCVPKDCNCGDLAKSGSRIYGGIDADVRFDKY